MAEYELPAEMQAEIDTGMASLTGDAVVITPGVATLKAPEPKAAEAKPAETAAAPAAADATPATTEEKAPEAAAETEVEAAPTEAAPAEAKVEEPTEIGKIALRLKRQERVLKEREQRVAAQSREARAQLQRLQQMQSQLEADQRLMGDDPLAWVQKRFGLTNEDIAHRLINGGKARPEESGSRAARELEELRAKIRTMEEATAQQNRAAAQERELVRFVGEARADAERWPLASKFSEARLRERGMQIATSARAPVSNADILDRIEEELSEIASLRAPAPVRPSIAKPPAKAPAAVVVPASTRVAPTLAAVASDGGGDSEPIDFIGLSPEEQRKALLRELRRVSSRNVTRN